MLKTLGQKYRAVTPKILHPYTKENIVAQLVLSGVLVGWMMHREWRADRELRRERENNITYMENYASRR